jgi:uncharacterized protein YcfL
MVNQNNSSPHLANVTFYDNSAIDQGGGIGNSGGTPTLMNITFKANTAANGGGIYNSASNPTITNVILWGNTNGDLVNVNSSVPIVTYSIVQGGYAGIGNLNSNPLLGVLANNGGFTQTMAVGVGSPAIDGGYDISCPNTDQRGVMRPQGSHCDIGAYEYGISTLALIGNAGVSGATMRFVDETVKTATADGGGNYAIIVPAGWSGNVTPYKNGYTFSPINKVYSNLQSNQSAQNYTATVCVSCADINVTLRGKLTGQYTLPTHGSTRASLDKANNGPVRIFSTNAVNLMGAERVIYKVNGINTSYSEMMALPNSTLDLTYWLPWYNNVDLDTQLRFANVSGSTATVHVYVNGVEMVGSPFTLAAGASTRQSFVGINNGPVKVVSNVNIVAAERVIYKVNGINTSYSEMMALPNSQLDMTYWLPWYNNVDLDTQLRFANVSGSTATVHVYVNGTEMVGSPFTLAAGASTRQSFVGINNGPVQIVSDVNIVAAERVIYKVSGLNTSFSEMMALPNSQLNTTYWLPWYNNVDLDTQLRFANVSGSTATVHVYVHGVEVVGSPFTLSAGASTRQSFVGINNGPVQIVSDVNIVAAERVIYKINGINTSFTEVMGLPNSVLDTSYWLPWYNNVDLDTQLRFGVP